MGATEARGILESYKQIMEASWARMHPAILKRTDLGARRQGANSLDEWKIIGVLGMYALLDAETGQKLSGEHVLMKTR